MDVHRRTDVPLHVTSTSSIPFPCDYTHMKLKPAHLHEPPFTTPVDRTSKGVWRQAWGRAHPRLGCYSLRLGVRFWAVLVPLHVTSTSPIPFPCGYTHMTLKPAHLHERAIQTAASRAIATAGGGVRDECVNNPKGIRDVSSASDTAMDDLKPDAQPQASSPYRTTKVLEWT